MPVTEIDTAYKKKQDIQVEIYHFPPGRKFVYDWPCGKIRFWYKQALCSPTSCSQGVKNDVYTDVYIIYKVRIFVRFIYNNIIDEPYKNPLIQNLFKSYSLVTN